MNTPNPTERTRVLLSFSSAYVDLARRIGNDLSTANIDVRYDQWQGGGGVPAIQSVPSGVDDVPLVLPLLTPSDAARTWIGDEWRLAIYDKAIASNIFVLPVRGGVCKPPDFLNERSFADLSDVDYAPEFIRLLKTIRDKSGDTSIKIPSGERDAVSIGSATTSIDNPLVLEVGDDLAHQLGERAVREFTPNMAPLMLDGLFFKLGVQFPLPRLRVTSSIPPWALRILVNDVPEHQVEVPPDSVMVYESAARMAEFGISAVPDVHPASGMETSWIHADHAALFRDDDYTTWDASEFLILALSAVLRRKAADFIGVEETRTMLELVSPIYPLLVSETVPTTASLFVLTDVLRRIVAEEVSIRNFRQILMALAKWMRVENDPHILAEYVLAALRRQITYKLSRGSMYLAVFLLDPNLESEISGAIQHTQTASYLELEAPRLKSIVGAIREAVDALPDGVQMPQILTVMEIRSHVRRLVATSMPRLHVLSYQHVYQHVRPDTNIQPIGRIGLDGF